MGQERTLHFGAGTAGNKSLMSFRAGHGITGYAGYCPSSEALMIPTKLGPSERAGPDASKDRGQPQWVLSKATEIETVYQSTINRSPTAKAGAPHPLATTGPERDTLRETQPPSPLKFLAKSLYGTTYCRPDDQMNTIKPIPTPARQRPAYLHGNSYAMSHGNSVELAHGVGFLENQIYQHPVEAQAKFKEVTMQPKDVRSSYSLDFGQFGQGLVGRLAATPDDMIASSTTRQLHFGTTKQYHRMPGYGGHMPENERGNDATIQAFNDHAMPDQKQCRLFTLGQFNLGMPGTMAFQPRDANNLMMEPKGKAGTASYFANELVAKPEVQAKLAAKRAAGPQHGNNQETKKFFQGGALMDSENGVANAEMFYRIVRPMEGLPRIFMPNARTTAGYRYGCYTDSVS